LFLLFNKTATADFEPGDVTGRIIRPISGTNRFRDF
jgi:hypothetical protein